MMPGCRRTSSVAKNQLTLGGGGHSQHHFTSDQMSKNARLTSLSGDVRHTTCPSCSSRLFSFFLFIVFFF
uniref:Uncharacterized protein n=2 Tax=Caenorhabditis tropicalis TaxID=1561998 RepID=A0A1I7UVT1_9PELO